MGKMTITLTTNKATGRKDIKVAYRSEDGALAMEHEADHKALVERLLGEGILSPGEVGDITVEREGSGNNLEIPAGMEAREERRAQSA